MGQATGGFMQAGGASLDRLRWIGSCGAVLALLILGASMWLRLTTVFVMDGQALSTLPPAIEKATRLLHRLCASGVALLALVTVVQCWTCRKSATHLVWPAAWMVASTVILSVIGPLTPGYRVGAIVVLNVTCGMVLVMAFWWLREATFAMTPRRHPMDRFAWAAIAMFLMHAASGAAASASEMRGVHWPAFVHLVSLLACIILIGVVLLPHGGDRHLTGHVMTLTGLLGLQLVVGYFLMWQSPRPAGMSFLHGMLSPLMAMALVSLARHGAPRIDQAQS